MLVSERIRQETGAHAQIHQQTSEATNSNREANRATGDPDQLYSIDEAGAALCCSRSSIYELLAAGKLSVVRLDARPRIRGEAIRRLAAGEA